MDLKDRTQEIAEWLRRTKTEWVATVPENTDIAIYLHFYRGDDLAVVLQCPLDRDTALNAAMAGCAGFAADTVAIAFESYHSSQGESPITGKPWMPGEMQFVFQEYPESVEKGWVNECITISLHERNGDYALYSMPYKVNGSTVEWEEEVFSITSTRDGEHGGGVMFDALQEAMARSTIEEELRKQSQTNPFTKMLSDSVSDPVARIFHTDMATYRLLQERNLVTGVIFFADSGSQREEMLEERIKEDPVLQDHQIIIENPRKE